MKIVGLTGGIASGKSFVVNYLKKLKIPTYDSDTFIGSLYKNPNKQFLSYLKNEGLGLALTNKKINKSIIRNIIFNNKNKKGKLEKFLHLESKKNRNIFLKINKNEKIVFLDIPLLFEKKLQKECDVICCVMAPLHIREKRALQRKGMNKKIFKLIVQNQVNDKTRKTNSDYLINTTLSKSKTYQKIDIIIYKTINKI